MGAVVHHRTHGSINNCFCLFICHLELPQDDRWDEISKKL